MEGRRLTFPKLRLAHTKLWRPSSGLRTARPRATRTMLGRARQLTVERTPDIFNTHPRRPNQDETECSQGRS